VLEAEREKIEPEYRDELTNSIDARFGEIEATLTAFDERLTFDPADIARAGVFVSIVHDGDLRVERGLCPAGRRAPGDSASHREGESGHDGDPANAAEPPVSGVQRAVITVGG
jgi:ParB family transcriptional regulator, chromosome partitioning protein